MTYTPTITRTRPEPLYGATEWYFAEGYTGSGFQTFILIENPNAPAATVDVTYILEGGGAIERTHVAPGRSRYTISAHSPAEVGRGRAFSTRLASNVPIIAERSMYWAEGGHCASGSVNRERLWMFPLGSTANGYETFILIMNPSDQEASVTVTYALEGGDTVVRNHRVAPYSRYTIAAHNPAELGPGLEFSFSVVADAYVVVERAIYWPGGGHASLGSMWYGGDWFFAEGFTGTGFATDFVLYNYSDYDTSLEVIYYLQGGGTISRTHLVPAKGRYVIRANDPDEVGPGQAFSTWITGGLLLSAERVMAWPGGGHASIGAAWPTSRGFLAEGFTGATFQTYVLVSNISSVEATLDVTYFLEGGGSIRRTHLVPPAARYTILANDPDEVGPGVAFSVLIDASTTIIVERAMYFPRGGHANIGAYWY